MDEPVLGSSTGGPHEREGRARACLAACRTRRTPRLAFLAALPVVATLATLATLAAAAAAEAATDAVTAAAPTGPVDRGTGSKALDPEVLTRVRETMTPLDLGRSGAAGDGDSGALDTYLDYYGLRPEGYEHRFGTFRSAGHVIAANALLPPSPRGTVLVMHGLFDHTGTLAATIRHILGLGFAVAAYDLPGHGLSSGRRASIEDFEIYAEVLDTFLGLVRAHMPAPYHAVAHSTGAAILVTRLLGHQDVDIEHVVLVAPLVRSAHWAMSTAGGRVVGQFLDEIPRVFRDNTSDEAFQSFVRADPLQPRSTSLRWLMALIEWNERIGRYPPSERPIVVLQGDEDDVVDWEYNIDFLGERFPRARIELIEGGRHQLLGESPRIRAIVTRLIDEALTAPAEVARPPAGG